MHQWLRALCFLAALLGAAPAHAVLVTYSGSNGLSATADFTQVDGDTIQIVLTNTSTSPFGGGGSDMVLSSINFDLGAVDIASGSVALGSGSSVVSRSGSAWVTQVSPNLNTEYAYSNTGVGNSGGSSISNALNSVTSHSNGGSALTRFAGGSGLPGGLTYGLVATGSSPFGNSNFILNSVVITLNLTGTLSDLSFLSNGTYVEFGSDYAYVPGTPDFPETPDEPVIPEPATLSLLSLGLAGVGFLRRRMA